MATRRKRIFAVLLAVLLLLPTAGSFFGTPLRAQAAAADSFGDHSLIAENENYALYMREQ